MWACMSTADRLALNYLRPLESKTQDQTEFNRTCEKAKKMFYFGQCLQTNDSNSFYRL